MCCIRRDHRRSQTFETGNGLSEALRSLATLANNATPANLRFRYSFDPNLGFLGGPYVPLVTVELQNLNFDFFSPLAGLASLAGATPSGNLGAAIPFPPMSVSMPGEDLALGIDG